MSVNAVPVGAIEDNGHIRWSGTFQSPALEAAYRCGRFSDDRWMIRICIVVVAISALVFIPNDFILFGFGPKFFVLLAARYLHLLGAIVVWLALRRCQGPWAMDRLLMVGCIVAGAFHLYACSTRPPTYTGHAILTVLSVIVMYCVVPLPWTAQSILTLLFSVENVALMIYLGTGMTATALAGACAAANALGAAMSWRLNRRQRQVFLAARRERALRVELEQALAEVRTLRGYLSICAWCKRIRDDQQDWQQLETYVQKHTHAQFSHAICPNCFRQHFGDDSDCERETAAVSRNEALPATAFNSSAAPAAPL
jgi:hypothetical protein